LWESGVKVVLWWTEIDDGACGRYVRPRGVRVSMLRVYIKNDAAVGGTLTEKE
jgi:hypothetical protein